MKIKDTKRGSFMGDLDDLQFRLSCATCALDAVHTAMEEGPIEPRCWLDGLYAITCHLRYLSDEFSARIESECGETKKEVVSA